MSAHTCKTLTAGCYRCDLHRDEIKAAQYDMRVEIDALREMAKDFRDIDMTQAADLCIEKAESLLADIKEMLR